MPKGRLSDFKIATTKRRWGNGITCGRMPGTALSRWPLQCDKPAQTLLFCLTACRSSTILALMSRKTTSRCHLSCRRNSVPLQNIDVFKHPQRLLREVGPDATVFASVPVAFCTAEQSAAQIMKQNIHWRGSNPCKHRKSPRKGKRLSPPTVHRRSPPPVRA